VLKKLAYAIGVWIAAVILGDTATGGDPLVEADMGAGRGQGIFKQEIADSAESFRSEDYQNFASGHAETFIEEARAASAAALQNLYKVFPVGSPVGRLVNFIESSDEDRGNYCRKRSGSADRIFCQYYPHLWAQDPEGILVSMWWLNIQYDPDTEQILEIRLRVGTARPTDLLHSA
jgi:hypothetical protein